MPKEIDETGKRYGLLTVVAREGSDGRAGILWRCRCACGGECVAPGWQLRARRAAHCGCRSPRRVFVPGRRFGRLTLVRAETTAAKDKAWICRCDCGNEARVLRSNLGSGKTKSCGCLYQETQRQIRQRRASRSDECGKRHPLYQTWRRLGVSRRLCREFAGGTRDGFARFLACVPPRPAGDAFLDTKRPRQKASPASLAWIGEQEWLRRSKRMEFLGDRPLHEVCREHGVSRALLWNRTHKGWELARAATTPPRSSGAGRESGAAAYHGPKGAD